VNSRSARAVSAVRRDINSSDNENARPSISLKMMQVHSESVEKKENERLGLVSKRNTQSSCDNYVGIE